MNIYKKLKGLFSKKETAVISDVAFEFAGHKFRIMDPTKMTKARQSAIFLTDYEREWGMTKKDLLAYDEMLMKQCEFPTDWTGKDDLVAQLSDKLRDMYNLIETKYYLIKEDFQFKPLLKVACHMILVDEENEKEIDGKYYNLKMQLCQTHKEIEVFFLNHASNFVASMTGLASTLRKWEQSQGVEIKPIESKVLTKIDSTIY